MTVKELIVELQKFDGNAEVMRLMTAEYGLTEIETITVKTNGVVVID